MPIFLIVKIECYKEHYGSSTMHVSNFSNSHYGSNLRRAKVFQKPYAISSGLVAIFINAQLLHSNFTNSDLQFSEMPCKYRIQNESLNEAT